MCDRGGWWMGLPELEMGRPPVDGDAATACGRCSNGLGSYSGAAIGLLVRWERNLGRIAVGET